MKTCSSLDILIPPQLHDVNFFHLTLVEDLAGGGILHLACFDTAKFLAHV